MLIHDGQVIASHMARIADYHAVAFRRGHNGRMGVLMLTRPPPVPELGVPKKRA
jgi:hypothetical protein